MSRNNRSSFEGQGNRLRTGGTQGQGGYTFNSSNFRGSQGSSRDYNEDRRDYQRSDFRGNQPRSGGVQGQGGYSFQKSNYRGGQGSSRDQNEGRGNRYQDNRHRNDGPQEGYSFQNSNFFGYYQRNDRDDYGYRNENRDYQESGRGYQQSQNIAGDWGNRYDDRDYQRDGRGYEADYRDSPPRGNNRPDNRFNLNSPPYGQNSNETRDYRDPRSPRQSGGYNQGGGRNSDGPRRYQDPRSPGNQRDNRDRHSGQGRDPLNQFIPFGQASPSDFQPVQSSFGQFSGREGGNQWEIPYPPTETSEDRRDRQGAQGRDNHNGFSAQGGYGDFEVEPSTSSNTGGNRWDRPYSWSPEPLDANQAISTMPTASSTLGSRQPRLSTASQMSETPLVSPTSSVAASIEDLRQATGQLAISQEQMVQGTSAEVQAENASKIICDVAIPCATREGKELVTLTTNFFPMEVSSKVIYRYDVSMTVVAADGRKVNLSKAPRDDAGRTQRHEICVSAIRTALEAYRLIREGEHAIYDQAAMLFSSESLEMVLKPHSNTIRVSIAELPANIRRALNVPEAAEIAIEIQPCTSGHREFDISKFKDAHKNRDLSTLDRSWQQFFDMLTTEPAVHGGKYTAFGSGKLFPKNVKGQDIGRGQERLAGINKGIAFIEPKEDKMVPALVLDAKMGQFFKVQNVILKICELMHWDPADDYSPFPFPPRETGDWKKINNYIRGMRFVMNTGNSEISFLASGITNCSIDQAAEEDIFGKKIPVLQSSRFNVQQLSGIRRHWPAIVVRGKHGKKIVSTHYPMEFLTLAKNQRVPMCKQDDGKPRAPRVQERFERIHRMIQELNLDSSSPQSRILASFGVRVASKPMKVQGIRRKAPAISFAGGRKAAVNPDNSSFRMDKFAKAGKADDIIVAFNCDEMMVNKMRAALEQAAKSNGIQVAKWTMLDSRQPKNANQKDRLEAVFKMVAGWKNEKKVGPTILLIYVDHEKEKSHGYLKLFERTKLIQTQHITIRVANDIPSKTATRQNIMNKMNCKLGGLNYTIAPEYYASREWISNGDTMVIGYDVAHPTSMSRDDRMDRKPPTEASVVGLSFNGAEDPEAFIGDFHYQLPLREQVADRVLDTRMKWMLKLFLKNRKKLPKNIIIIRDGVSEGQYNMVANNEFMAIQDAALEFRNMLEDQGHPGASDWKPKYVLVIVCKRHNKRFAVETNGKFANAKSGTVVDSSVVRPDMTHFYMQPHHAIQGTSKFPSFHVILNKAFDTKTQDSLQAFILALCFNHQIFAGSISIPEPVYQADEWAKRGSDIWKVYEELYFFPKLEKYNENLYSEAPIDYEKMTEQLCYKNTAMVENRVNA